MKDAKKIREELKKIAEASISYAASLAVSSLVRTQIGNIDIMTKDCQNKSKDEIDKMLVDKSTNELQRVTDILHSDNLKKYTDELFNKLTRSIAEDTNEWKDLIPGRPILNQFVAKTKMQIGRAKQLYIKEVQKSDGKTFQDIIDIFTQFNAQ